MAWLLALNAAAVSLTIACSRPVPSETPVATASTPRPSILFVTLDTTRADAMGPGATGVNTPSFNALAARGRLFTQAYATVPQTLPSHSSMLTGLYPGGHGVHENGRFLSGSQTLISEKLKAAGYRTAAFVSAFALARRFGLARGFDIYDDQFEGSAVERAAKETTDKALAYLQQSASQPLFLWVHYYDPHYPYTPPEPFRSQYSGKPYLGEVASMDQQLGRLVEAFERGAPGPCAIVVAADHGEGLGEHGEAQHGNLLYQATMHVPLLLVGPGVTPGVVDTPASTRRIFHTLLDWAGLGTADSLRGSGTEVLLGEAMKPFFDFGWQPQVMGLEGRLKAIVSKRTEVYDVIADPGEMHDLTMGATLSRPLRTALIQYPIPSLNAAESSAPMDDEGRQKLASLGYVSREAKPVIRADAPRSADMTHLFEVLDKASGLFVREQYAQAIPLLERILTEDPHNLDAVLRLATSHSALGHDDKALAAFQRAGALAPDSPDVRAYLGLHYARTLKWDRAVPLLERAITETPDRLPALEALSVIRERQGRFGEAVALREKINRMRTPTPSELTRLGELAMDLGRTDLAIESFEKAHAAKTATFTHDLELGVLYLAAGRLAESREALERVAPSSPKYPMALFKRAQVSVLLHEPDQLSRIERARQHADGMTRELIAKERLFQAGQKP